MTAKLIKEYALQKTQATLRKNDGDTMDEDLLKIDRLLCSLTLDVNTQLAKQQRTTKTCASATTTAHVALTPAGKALEPRHTAHTPAHQAVGKNL